MSGKIRQANFEDLLGLEECARAFFANSGQPGVFNFEHFLATLKEVLQANYGVVFLLENESKIIGAIGGLIYPDSNTGDLTATESYWFVLKEHRRGLGGIRLYKAFKSWAIERGCLHLRMGYLIASMPEDVARFYEREGFTAIEVNYSKPLT